MAPAVRRRGGGVSRSAFAPAPLQICACPLVPALPLRRRRPSEACYLSSARSAGPIASGSGPASSGPSRSVPMGSGLPSRN